MKAHESIMFKVNSLAGRCDRVPRRGHSPKESKPAN